MRRRARQCALQILYQLDINRQLRAPDEPASHAGESLERTLQEFWSSFEHISEADRTFSERLARGVVREQLAVDAAIEAVSSNWRLARMEVVDRNLLRLATYEILWCPDIPRAASINEALELAKRFHSRDAAAFINGVLDRLGDQPPTHADDETGSTSG